MDKILNIFLLIVSIFTLLCNLLLIIGLHKNKQDEYARKIIEFEEKFKKINKKIEMERKKIEKH